MQGLLVVVDGLVFLALFLAALGKGFDDVGLFIVDADQALPYRVHVIGPAIRLVALG